MNKEKKTLLSLDKYQALGFDADHCLIRYKLAEFFAMLYKRMAKILVEEKSYPREILNYGKKEKCFIMNGLVVDYTTGYILKLGEDKVILRAYYGHERVSHEELESRFGTPPKYEIFDPYHCFADRYMCCLSFFDCYVPAVLAHMVEYKKKVHHPEQINAEEIVKDAHYAAAKGLKVYLNDSLSQVDSLIYRQDKLREILLKLRQKGKTLFIASNAPPQYLDALMSHAFGKDWKSIFDFVIGEAGKPKFFLENTPFYEVTEDLQVTDKEVKELFQNKIYTAGNAKLVEENIARIRGGNVGRVLFFGDNYSTDVLAAEKIAHWDGVCIIEELGDVDFGEGYDESEWGHWKYEETPYGNIPTFWYSYMSKNVAMCTSVVDSIDMANFYES